MLDGEPGPNSPFAQSILKELSAIGNVLLNVGILAHRVFKLVARQYKDQKPGSGPLHGVGDEGGNLVSGHVRTKAVTSQLPVRRTLYLRRIKSRTQFPREIVNKPIGSGKGKEY